MVKRIRLKTTLIEMKYAHVADKPFMGIAGTILR